MGARCVVVSGDNFIEEVRVRARIPQSTQDCENRAELCGFMITREPVMIDRCVFPSCFLILNAKCNGSAFLL